MRTKPLILALALAGLTQSPAACAGEREKLEALRQTAYAILDALVEKGILSNEAARDLVRKAEKKGHAKAAEAEQAEAAAGVVRVPYIPEVVKREIREQIRQEVVAQAKIERWGDVNAVPDWVDRLKWEGDLRVRQQNDLYADGNAAQDFNLDGTVDNTTEDRQRLRVRARLGLTARLTESVAAGVRLATGNNTDPVSTNQTLGNTAGKYSLWVDRAFIKAEPWEWLSVSGGRIPNPFFSTDLVWDDDLNFEGLAATLRPWPREERTFKPFATLGVFPLQEVETSTTNLAKDKWLYGAQIGADWRAGSNTRWRVGLAYYDYRNVQGIPDTVAGGGNPYAASAPQSRQKGNTVFDLSPDDGLWGLAADYDLVNLTATVDLDHWEPVHLVGSLDLVKNVGYDRARVDALTGTPQDKRTRGWHARLALGMPGMSRQGNWQVYLGYRHLERDAVLDAFTDSDFRLGGTDAKGYYLGVLYALDRNAWLSAKWMSADAIDGLPFGVDVFQLDFNAKF